MRDHLPLSHRLTRLVACFCSLALAGSLVPVSSASAAPVSDSASLEIEVNQAASRLDELNTELEIASEELYEVEGEIDGVEADVKAVKKKQKQTKAELATAKDALSDSVLETYKNGTVSYIEVLLGATSFDDFASKLYLLELISQNRSDAIEDVMELQTELSSQEAELTSSLEELETLEARSSEEQASIESSIESSQALYDSLTEEMQEAVNEEMEEEAAEAAESEGETSAEEGTAVSAASEEKSSKSSASSASSASKSGKSSSSKQPSGSSSSSSSGSSSSFSSSSSSSSSGSTSTSGSHPEVVSIAKKYLGVAYSWGGSSPSTGFDCSGFTMYCYAQIGISLSHSSQAQYYEGTHIARSALMPGDLVFFGGSTSSIHHVGIYVGGGQYIHSPRTGDVVKISSLSSRSDYVGACRP